MIKIFSSLSLFLLGLLAHAQTTATRTVSTFSKIEVGPNIELVYTETVSPSIKVSAMNTEKLSNISTEIKNGTLKITNKDKQNDAMYKVYVTGNSVSSIKALGAKITVKNQLSATEFNLVLNANATFAGNVKSAKKITLCADQNATFNGRIETESFDAVLSDNAKICLTGTANAANLNADGRTLCLAGNFAAAKMRVNANDYAYVKVHAQDGIDIKIAEMARVTYTGKPTAVTMSENAIVLNGMITGAIASN